ncbi:hypothetical protein [Micromonospora saelicesensis]|uniref:hypothetical protein n=1 Tax=Micromonospora saelicesensis TaxID=285676 RepID=UPI0011BF4058|nr:hypothetical protein [Micromonospora saelicesensis]
MSLAVQRALIERQIKQRADALLLQYESWKKRSALPHARSLSARWSELIKQHGSAEHRGNPIIHAAVRRAALRVAAHEVWFVREAFMVLGIVFAIAAFVLAPVTAGLILNEPLTPLGIFGVALAGLLLSGLGQLLGYLISRIPPISLLPLSREVLALGIVAGTDWWLVRSDGREVIAQSLKAHGAEDGGIDKAIAFIPHLFLTAVAYLLISLTLEIQWRILDYQTPAEVVSRLVHGHLPPLLIATTTYLILMSHLDHGRAVLTRRRRNRPYISSIRFHRHEMVREIDRCIRSLGCSPDDRRLYRERAAEVCRRLEKHERALVEAFSPACVDKILSEMAYEAELLVLEGWGDVGEGGSSRPASRLLAISRRYLPPILLVGLAIAFPHIPGIRLDGAAIAAAQATLLTAAVAALAAPTEHGDSKISAVTGRRGVRAD